jgi:hypothetical protein
VAGVFHRWHTLLSYRAKDAVLKVGSKRKSGQAQIALTPKQMQIVEFITLMAR